MESTYIYFQFFLSKGYFLHFYRTAWKIYETMSAFGKIVAARRSGARYAASENSSEEGLQEADC